MADSTTAYAVWPSPQMDASRIATPMSSRSVTSRLTPPSVRPEAIRCSASSCRTVPTRHGTHFPHDSSRKNSAMRRTTCLRSVSSPNAITTPDPSVAFASREPSSERTRSTSSGRMNVPAAPPSRSAESVRAPASWSSERSVVPQGTSYTPGLATAPLKQNRRVPVDCAVPVRAYPR